MLKPAEATGGIAPRSDVADPLETFRPLFAPKTVAVLGASTKDVAIANTFIRRMKAFGYDGAIYPIHPTATEIEGLRAYPDLASTPEIVDYAYVAIGAARIPDIIAAAAGRCRIAQVISSGFGEVEEGRALEVDLADKARRAGVRVLGPNCLGTYSPRGKLTFSFQRTTGGRLHRRRIAVGRAVDGHHQARPVAWPALQRTRNDREQHRRNAARAARLLSCRSADQGGRPLHRGRQGRTRFFRSAAFGESHQSRW